MPDKIIPALSFDFLTPFYDFLSELVGFGRKEKMKVVTLMKLNGREKILDVGCGTGTLMIMIKEKFPKTEVHGVEVDPKILSIAGKKVKKAGLKIELAEASAAKLPFVKESFDAVVSSLIFHHLPTEVKTSAIREIYRILKPAGRFLLADFGQVDGFWWKSYYLLLNLFRIPEAKTLKDNLEGKIPLFLKEAGFKYKEAAPRYMGIQYLLCRKIS